MRSVIIKAACIAAIVGSPWIASSQEYYVVVGAFAADENASEFKAFLPGQELDTSYTRSENGKLLHFYVLKTSDKETALSRTMKLKKEIDAWDRSAVPPVQVDMERKVSAARGSAVSAEPSDVTAFASESRASSGTVSSLSASTGKIPAPPVGKYFNFMVESPEGTPLPAQVHHVDFDQGMELAAYRGNTFVDLLRPGHTDEPMAVVCGVFGYKEIHKYIDYTNPSATDEEAFVDAQGVWVIPYKLERVEKGDVSVMYNVSFYKDAVIMRKDSETDLEELVKMMHSNPYYEITIHAHCNGKKKREIIGLGANKNYFDVAGSVKLDGTAKDLTMLRADAIRSYLIDHGIDGSRIQVYPWGGSDMLVKAESPNANINDRIEIEFTRD